MELGESSVRNVCALLGGFLRRIPSPGKLGAGGRGGAEGRGGGDGEGLLDCQNGGVGGSGGGMGGGGSACSIESMADEDEDACFIVLSRDNLLLLSLPGSLARPTIPGKVQRADLPRVLGGSTGT